MTSSKTRLIGSAPVLLVADVVAAANYYRDKLGFNYEQLWGEPPCFVILDRDGYHLMLSQVDAPDDIMPNQNIVDELWDVYFWVNNVNQLCSELKANGVIMAQELADQPYGCREFAIRDLDGHSIAFGEDIDGE